LQQKTPSDTTEKRFESPLICQNRRSAGISTAAVGTLPVAGRHWASPSACSR